MNVTLCGAAGGCVTGSGYLVDTGRSRVLVDFGMFQGAGVTDERNRSIDPVDPSRLDAIVLTHAHLDHSGRLPILTRHGYRGPIFTTAASIDFSMLILEDAGRIQEQDAARENRDIAETGRPAVTPIYDLNDVGRLRGLWRSCRYNESVKVTPDVSVRFRDAGHILGSTSVQMAIAGPNGTKTIDFSGDIGRWNTPILRDPELPDPSDFVFLESTYGDRDHRSIEETRREFNEILNGAIRAGTKVLIPAFAIGRTQQLLFYIAQGIREGALPRFPIYLDSPMAIKATELYVQHQDIMDEEMHALAAKRQISKDLADLHYVETGEQSRTLNDRQQACVIIAGGGMCDGGRIVHHLKHNLWRPNVAMIAVGFMAEGSLGRKLVDGAKHVHILGKPVDVKATIHTLGGFSGHAGQGELLKWFAPIAGKTPKMALTHGENPQRQALAAKLSQQFQVKPYLPEIGESLPLD